MVALEDLPPELLDKVLRPLARSDISNLRLTSQGINQIAVAVLFEEATLYAHWWTDEDDPSYKPEAWSSTFDYSSQSFMNILEHNILKNLVKKVTVYTCETHCDHHPKDYNEVPQAQYDEQWENCFDRIREFPNLRSIKIIFDRHVYENMEFGPLMTAAFRQLNLDYLLSSLDHPIRELSVRNYYEEYEMDMNGKRRITHDLEELSKSLSHLTSLRLSVVHEEKRGEQGPILRMTDPHSFWLNFPDRFLKPTQHTLKHLTLYSSLPVGWFPKIDLREVHLATLETLALGQFMFSHDSQLEWILSHQASLRELYLDHCSILRQRAFAIHGWLDEDGFPRFNHPSLRNNDSYDGWGDSLDPEYDDIQAVSRCMRIISYDSRWHQFFHRFAESLPHLREFRFGTSTGWDFNTESPYLDDGIGLPLMPWEQETDITNQIFQERYLVYDDWENDYSVNWYLEDKHKEPWKQQGWLAQLNPPPQCDEEDLVALQTLLSKLSMLSTA